jgi:prepilin-type processing-associated H-X9-DG protein
MGRPSFLGGHYWYDDGGYLLQDTKFVAVPINFSGPALPHSSATPFTSAHPGGANAVMADGSVRFLLETTPLGLLQRMATRTAGDPY